jgi:hypothetical protein
MLCSRLSQKLPEILRYFSLLHIAAHLLFVLPVHFLVFIYSFWGYIVISTLSRLLCLNVLFFLEQGVPVFLFTFSFFCPASLVSVSSF